MEEPAQNFAGQPRNGVVVTISEGQAAPGDGANGKNTPPFAAPFRCPAEQCCLFVDKQAGRIAGTAWRTLIMTITDFGYGHHNAHGGQRKHVAYSFPRI
jgi:hypothetical protein